MSHEHPYEDWQPVIGLEIHTQLNTRTKMFSRAPNKFGSEPNTNISYTDTAQPGSLPVLNREAVKKAVAFGLAIDARIARYSRFDRKSYFYPDCPRNYQITQFDYPLILGGVIEADVEGKTMRFEVEHAHLEDDAGMLKHFNTFAGVDFNRAGVPLIEIVSKPCIHSPKQAVAYATAIKAILEYADVSDCNMEEGGLRMDVNISVRKRNETILRNRIEIKNMNSFANMEIAIESEIKRQIRLYTSHPDKQWDDIIPRGTFRFDLETGETVMLRKKERLEDYRYFPEPDLPPLFISDAYIEEVRSNLPELPRQRYARYVEKLGLSPYNAALLVDNKALCDQYEAGLRHTKNATSLCNWLTVEFVGRLKERDTSLAQLGIPIEHVAELVDLIDSGTITGKIAKSVADLMIETPGKAPSKIVEENPDLKPISDEGAIEAMVDQVLAENPDSIELFKSGRDKAFNFMVGQVMKLCKGQANPTLVRDLLLKKIK